MGLLVNDLSPFFISDPELMALASPIIQWLKQDGRDLVIIASAHRIMVGYTHTWEKGKAGTQINTLFFPDRIEIKTDADCASDDAFATFTDFADPNLFNNIIMKIVKIQRLGDRNEVFRIRDERRATLNLK